MTDLGLREPPVDYDGEDVAFRCQVHQVRTGHLPCPARCSGSYARCERTDVHGPDEHQTYIHTIAHAKWGDGYTCSAIERALKEGIPWP